MTDHKDSTHFRRPPLWLLVLLCCSAVVDAAPRVLLLNSYHPQYKWTAELTRGVQDELAGIVAEEHLHIEFLDGRRMVDNPGYFAALRAMLVVKYGQFHPDIIITSDDYALEFMLAEGDHLFGASTPVVFCGINVYQPDALRGHDNYTGLLEGMEVAGNLDLIARLQPQVKRIVLLADRTSFGLRMSTQAKEAIAARRNGTIQYEIWDDFRWPQLLQQVALLPADSALLMLAIHQDSAGRYFSFAGDLPVLTMQATVPVYGMWGALMIGHGVLGGMMNNPYQHGRAAAARARQILQGQAPRDLPLIEKAEYLPYFDERVLRRFGIDVARLPAGSTRYFQPNSFYDRHKSLVWGSASALAALLLIISVLSLNIARRKRAEIALRHLNEELEARVQQRTAEIALKADELERLNETMARMAYTDLLTELPNRRAGMALLHSLLRRLEQDHGSASVATFDVDHFKNVNDQYGHDVGDKVLIEIALRARASIRPIDRLFRWGGEEYLIVLPQADQATAGLVGERVRAAIELPSGTAVNHVTISVGISTWRPDDSAEQLLQRADAALYRAKANGRNRVVSDADEQSDG